MTNIHKNSRYQIRQTTVKMSVTLQRKVRKQANDFGMKMFDYVEWGMGKLVEAVEYGEASPPRPALNGFGGKVRKSVSKIK